MKEVADSVMKERLKKVSFHLENLEQERVRENKDPIMQGSS